MDYSQFMIMHHELGLLVVFLFGYGVCVVWHLYIGLFLLAVEVGRGFLRNVCHIANRDVDKEHIECRYVHRAFAINQVE